MSEIDDQLACLDHQALRQAYTAHMLQLFATWMRDPTEQPERLRRGAEKARKAFKEAHEAIEKRRPDASKVIEGDES
jgi:hypothetical protein